MHKMKGDFHSVQSETNAMPPSECNNDLENQNEGDLDGLKLISNRNEGNSQASADMLFPFTPSLPLFSLTANARGART